MDQSHNTSSTSPEAVYANELIVPAGATLNLNNLHLYVRGDQIAGTILGGTIVKVPVGGSLALNAPTPGTLTPAGAVDDWTFYGTAGESITIQLNPGSGGSNAGPLAPTELGPGRAAQRRRQPRWRRPPAASSGAIATISGFTLPASGTYTIQVAAAPAQASSTGNYVLSAYNVTATVHTLTVNQQENGTINNPFGLDQWVLHRLGRAAGPARRDRHQRRRPVRPDRARQSDALLGPPVRLQLDHAAVERELRIDGTRFRRPGRFLCLRAGADLGDAP